jgi:predicted lipoprotein with Yx(FWY)xxD motif
MGPTSATSALFESQRVKENQMNTSKYPRSTTPRTAPRRVAGSVVALLGLTAAVAVPGIAGASSAHATKGVVVSTVKNSKFGTLLVSGKTLYTLKASKTACATSCLKIWPELVLPKGVTKATAGSGVSASKLGTITRAGGVRQVTSGGKALYFFSEDKTSGADNGNVNDTWGTWSDVVTVKLASGSPTTTTTIGGTGGVSF